MGLWDYFSKKGRTLRRLASLLEPTEHERLHEVITFGNPKKSAQRIVTKKSIREDQLTCTFLIFEKECLTHFTTCPSLNNEQYQRLLTDLTKKYKSPKRKEWKEFSQALETVA